MADNKPTHRLLLATERETRSGGTTTTKTVYHELCALWPTKSGGMSGELPKGLSVSGRLVIVPADRAEGDAGDDSGLSDH